MFGVLQTCVAPLNVVRSCYIFIPMCFNLIFANRFHYIFLSYSAVTMIPSPFFPAICLSAKGLENVYPLTIRSLSSLPYLNAFDFPLFFVNLSLLLPDFVI